MTVQWETGDVFDRLATLEDESVDLVVTSPPFLALRSYLPADHPEKDKEIGSEATPAEFLDTLLAVSAELRRVLAPHGSICVELGDTYAGSGGAGGDYDPGGWRDGQMKWARTRGDGMAHPISRISGTPGAPGGAGWPLAKSKTLIPELYRIGLAYGINPLTGAESPAGRWRVRNVVTWCRPNPPVGALGDKWRPATSDIVVACLSDKRYWDDVATRKPHKSDPTKAGGPKMVNGQPGQPAPDAVANLSGAPLLDYWEIPPGGYKGAHYAVYPPELVAPFVQTMLPPKVCVTCGEPSRRIVGDVEYVPSATYRGGHTNLTEAARVAPGVNQFVDGGGRASLVRQATTLGWTDCGHDTWRPPVILDPFAGTGTTLATALGHNPDTHAIGIDLDPRNEVLAANRLGLFWQQVSSEGKVGRYE